MAWIAWAPLRKKTRTRDKIASGRQHSAATWWGFAVAATAAAAASPVASPAAQPLLIADHYGNASIQDLEEVYDDEYTTKSQANGKSKGHLASLDEEEDEEEDEMFSGAPPAGINLGHNSNKGSSSMSMVNPMATGQIQMKNMAQTAILGDSGPGEATGPVKGMGPANSKNGKSARRARGKPGHAPAQRTSYLNVHVKTTVSQTSNGKTTTKREPYVDAASMFHKESKPRLTMTKSKADMSFGLKSVPSVSHLIEEVDFDASDFDENAHVR